MAGAPAYRYDYYSNAVPAQQPNPQKPSPQISVMPGGKAQQGAHLSDGAVLGLRILVAVLLCFVVIGFVRVGLASAAYSVASESTELRADISDARSEQEALAVEKSTVANPVTLRDNASKQLKMAAPTAVEHMTLSADVVVTDDAGNLSLTGSVAQVAQQG